MPHLLPQLHLAGRARLAVALLIALAALFPAAPAHAQEDAAPTAAAAAVITADRRVNVRSGPGTDFAVVGKLEPGASVTVLARSDAGDWLRVRAVHADGLAEAGWVSAALVSEGTAAATAGATATVAPTASPGAESPFARAVKGRSAASPAPTPAATPTPAPTEAADDAALESTPESTPEGTDAGSLLAGEPDGAPVAVTRPASMNVRGGPGVNYPAVGAVPAGTRLEITGVSPAGDWYRVAGGELGEQAWVFGGLVSTVGALESVARLGDGDIPEPPAASAAPAAASSAASASSGAPVAAAPAPSGGGGFNYGITAQMWQSDKGSVGAAVQDLGFSWVKQQVRWEFVETAPGAVNWQEMDGIVNTMNGYGVNVAFSVVTAPDWTRPGKGGTNGPPEDFQLLANFLGAMAGRYCGQSLKAIEVWNEQNLQREWEGYPLDPALYMDLLKRSYASIKAACPAMIVVSGATTPAGYSDVAFDDIDYLRGMYANGLARYSDAVGIHPSGFGNPPSVRFGDWASGGYDAPSHVNHRSFYFLSTLEESRRVMEEFGDTGKRLWPTEFGWGSTVAPHPGYEYEGRISEAQQAQWSSDAYRIMANSGYVGVAFLWNLNYNYGEMAAFAVAGRPAYAALKGLTGR